ncbi:acetyl-CoA acetyltransferase [Labrys miyagiensis]|uniref:Acetyl-CoA acetyltransferase n=1 Tax=Labrys miyagiensis TaxID=346912 RepID=A0ABQ6CL63_9HYPH|nr:acetyl-CoA C-acyltransferase [Labrys miyagiensis]GLS18966.1 acetyl-CoA acetyltransferase [Labrys miyagiensis]
MADDPIVIASYARTPIGSFQGTLSSLKATELGARAVHEAVKRAEVEGDAIDQIFIGCVLAAGLGQAPARQAAIGAGLPDSVAATTVNKVCGSGLQAAILASGLLATGAADIVVAGGMESMSNAPYLLAKHRSGARIGHDRIVDSLYLDGLEDAYDEGRLMGTFAEETASAHQITRAAQDAFALESLARARQAQDNGAFEREIVPVLVKGRNGDSVVQYDEQPKRADPSRIPQLKPAFGSNGTITAANASSISDGAAALVLTRASVARERHLPQLARIAAHAVHAQAPADFTTAPAPAIRKALVKAGWDPEEVDLYEINEAFAVVALLAMQDLAIPREKLNVNGGACALGHPIGASGARVMATLLAAMEERGAQRGVASLCIGGGEAVAMAVERLGG